MTATGAAPAKIVAILLVAISAYAIHAALGMRLFAHGAPGAGLFPLIAGIGLALSSLVWLAQTVRYPAVSAYEETTSKGLVRLALQFGSLVAFVFIMQYGGYIPASILLVVATAWIAGARNILWIGVVALICSFGVQAGARLLGAPI